MAINYSARYNLVLCVITEVTILPSTDAGVNNTRNLATLKCEEQI